MINNIIIGKPLVSSESLLATDPEDWLEQKEKTLFTDERFLPKILVELGVFKSNSDVKRNRPDLFVNLSDLDCLELKVGRHRLYVIVGE